MPAKDRVSYFYDGERSSQIISLELVHVVTGAQFLEVEVFGRREGCTQFPLPRILY